MSGAWSTLGAVVSIARHPVKSLQGEPVDVAHVTTTGIVGDRAWAVCDVGSGAALSAKREPRLLAAGARIRGEGVVVTVPGTGERTGTASDDALSTWLGREVALRPVPASGPSYVDLAPLHLVDAGTLAALGAASPDSQWDPRRFRANLVLRLTSGSLDALVGERLRIGAVTVDVLQRTRRCSMTTAAQPDLPKDLGILRTLARGHDTRIGVYAAVVATGPVRCGDPVTIAG